MFTRREFCRSTAATLGAAAVSLGAAQWSRVLGANDTIRVGIIGFNSKGAQHIDVFRSLPGVRVTALCDVDQTIVDREAAKFKERGEEVTTFQDLRHLLDRQDIDAVVIATPNHWHSLAAIWAVQSGKDVYVEKPISHNIREGRLLVEAARKHHKIVQSGTQNRSDVGLRAFKDYLNEGHLGKVLWAHGIWFKLRSGIGRVNGPQAIPAGVDYNLWTGPAPLTPLMRANLHYDWHWFWETGNGDMANIGVHQIDDCRFLCDLHGNPKRVISLGERWAFDDDGQTPNTHLALVEYDIPLLIETRNLPMSPTMNIEDHVRGVRMGNIIMCENGYFAGGRGGGWVYDPAGTKVKQFPGDGGEGHAANFIEAVRARDASLLHSDVEEGHFSAVVCHAANISYRLGKKSSFEEIENSGDYSQEARERITSMREHLAANQVDIANRPVVIGAALDFNPQEEQFVGPSSYEANMFLFRNYREPFVVPQSI
ncbi:MAG: gfo/Idh/MocA family oxidoreductase [Calditrichaeota bacterium]|nr:MAG: gfo/Idh/MocA family oxidoreductase [Calditrichota bacterium]